MYGELGASEQSAVESHLLDCTPCTDEFAEIAHARYSVYEWHAEEFVPLRTPEISIPYRQAANAVGVVGLIVGIRELFSNLRWPAAVAAMLTIAIGAGFTALFLFSGGEEQIAVNQRDQVVPVAVVQDVKPVAIVDETKPAEEVAPEAPRIQTVRKDSRPLNPKPDDRRKPPVREVTAEAPESVDTRELTEDRRTASRENNAPVLSSFEENDDRSLRLADLVDDGGTR
jgi:hypothetical protein